MDMVYMMVNENGQTEPVQLVNASGVPQPLDANDPLVARLNTGPGSGRPVRLSKERNEFVEAVEFTEYHYFVDENNKVIPIPPGSIVHGEFEDEEEEDDSMEKDLQENDQLKNDLMQVSSEIDHVAGEMELSAAKCKVHLEEDVVPCSEEDQEFAGHSETAETKLDKDHQVASFGDFGMQDHSVVATMDETGELHLENASETIFTQDEIELEEEVVSLQISEPELVSVKPSVKHSKKAANFTSYHDISSSTGRSTDASSVSELQVRSPVKKSKKKVLPTFGTASLQASAVEKIPLQSGKKGLHHSVEPHVAPNVLEPSFTDSGRPKRSVPRRSALEMLHGEGKSARKLHTSSGSDSEGDGVIAAQHSGKKRQSKGAEKKALAAEKLTKTPLLSNTEYKNEAQLISTPHDLSMANADLKCVETVEVNSVNNLPLTTVQSPVASVKRGKGRPRKLAPESPRIVETLEVARAVQKELVSMESESTVEARDGSGHQATVVGEEELPKVEVVVTSEIDVVSEVLELSDSKVLLTANDSNEPALIDVLELGGIEIKVEHSEVVTPDTVGKAEKSAGSRRKPFKHSRGRRKSMGEQTTNELRNPKNEEEMAMPCVETGATIVRDIRQVAFDAEEELSIAEADVTSEIDVVSKDFELSESTVLSTTLNSNDSTEPAFIDVLELSGIEVKVEHSEIVASDTVEKVETSAGSRRKPLKRGRGRPKGTGGRKASGLENPKNAEGMDKPCVDTEATISRDIRHMETEVSVGTTSEHLLRSPEHDVEISNLDGELRSGQMVEDARMVELSSNLDEELRSGQVTEEEGQVARFIAEDLNEKESHLATFECSSSICEWEAESLCGNLVKQDCKGIGDICDDSTTTGHAICIEVEGRQLDNGSRTVKLVIQEQQEEHLFVDEAMAAGSEIAAECLFESDVPSANDEIENTVTSQDACHMTKTDKTTVEAEIYNADWDGGSYLVESQSEKLNEKLNSVDMPEDLSGNETLEIENKPAGVSINVNHGAMHAEDVLGSNEKCHAPVPEEEEDATLDRQVHDEEDIQDFDRESTGEPDAAANLSTEAELVGEERNVDRMRVSSQLTRLLLKHLQGSDEHGKKAELEPTVQKFEEGVSGLDNKAALLLASDLEQFAVNIRCRLADREADRDVTDSAINQLPLPREERVRRLVVAELTKLRALDQELDERHSQLMVMRGQLSRHESDVKQREQRLERSRMLLELEKEALDEDRRKLLKERESLQKQRKLYVKLRENKKRKAETETELSTSSKKVRIVSSVQIKERRPLFEAMTAIKETKTLTDPLQAFDKGSSSELQLSLQKQISSSADECDSKDCVKIDAQILPDMPVEMSCVKAEEESEEKSDVKKNDVPVTPSGVSTVVKGKKELLRRFAADELNSPGDEHKSSKSLLHKQTEDQSKPSKSSSQKPTADEPKPSKISSQKPTADEPKPSKTSSQKPTADEPKPSKTSSQKPTADEQKPSKSSSQKLIADEQKPSKSSSQKSTADEQKPSKSSSHKSTADEQKPSKSSSLKLTADEQKPRKSLSLKPTADEQKSKKSSSTADGQKSSKSLSHEPKKLEMPSSTASNKLQVKKSGQPSKEHIQNPAISSLTAFDCLLNQSESLKSKKNASPMAGSHTGTNPKSSGAKRPSQSDSERQKDLPSSPRAKKQHFDGTDVHDSTESSSKSGYKVHGKRLSTHSDSSSKKKDKQCKRMSVV